MLNYLRFEPGEVLPFSTKLIYAPKVFSEMLQVAFLDTSSTPIVLISDMHSKAMATVETFVKNTQHEMFLGVSEMGTSNLVGSISELGTNWESNFSRANEQTVESIDEQKIVSKKITSAMNKQFGASTLTVNQQVFLSELLTCIL